MSHAISSPVQGRRGRAARQILSFVSRKRPATLSPARHYVDAHLRALLTKRGCPVCLESRESDDKYFFWFLNESYGFPHVLVELADAFGFCAAHGHRLNACAKDADAIAFAHGHVTRLTLDLLSQAAGDEQRLRRSALIEPHACPACASMERVSERVLFFLDRLLEDPAGAELYGNPGLLCFPHFQSFAQRLRSPALFQRLLSLHLDAMTRAGHALAAYPEAADAFPAVLDLAVGGYPGQMILPAIDIESVAGERRDTIGDFAAQLDRDDACPVCVEVRRAWRDWIAWLERTVSGDQNLEDVLPTCREHVWACVRHGSPALATAAVRNALMAALRSAHNGHRALTPAPSSRRDGWMARLRRVTQGSGRRFREARQAVAYPIRCPVCERLATARDRATHLLFALLLEQRQRTAFEAGHGLCLKHFSHALSLRPPPAVQTVLIETETAKLALLRWELEEALRKRAWSARPEPGGSERTAWQRALRRFSGTFDG